MLRAFCKHLRRRVGVHDPTRRMPNPRCFFDVSIGDELAGRLVFELFGTQCPKTVENFRRLCVGTRTDDGRTLQYKGCAFHRVIDWFICQVCHNNVKCVSVDGK